MTTPGQARTHCETLLERPRVVCTPAVSPLKEKRTDELCVSVRLLVCVRGGGDRGQTGEIYITKHPQVHGERSNIQMWTGSIKAWFQDVIEGEEGEAKEKKEANGCCPDCTQQERA